MARFDFQELVERLPLVVYVDKLDDKSSPLYVSPQIAQLMGYSQEEWLADPDLFTNSLHPDDRERVLADIADRNAGLTVDDDVSRLPPDRARRPCRLDPRRRDRRRRRGRPPGRAQGYMQDVTARRQDSIRLELLVGILSLAADETPPDEIVAHAAESLAALFGDVNVSYVERRDEAASGSATRPTRASPSSGTRSSGRPTMSSASSSGPIVVEDIAEEAWLDPVRDQLIERNVGLVRGCAALPQRRAGRRPLVQQLPSPQVGRGRGVHPGRRRRPARDRPRQRSGPRAARPRRARPAQPRRDPPGGQPLRRALPRAAEPRRRHRRADARPRRGHRVTSALRLRERQVRRPVDAHCRLAGWESGRRRFDGRRPAARPSPARPPTSLAGPRCLAAATSSAATSAICPTRSAKRSQLAGSLSVLAVPIFVEGGGGASSASRTRTRARLEPRRDRRASSSRRARRRRDHA